MHDSRIARAMRKATEEATRRGHTLGSWGFMHGQAANVCERDGCGCSVLVTPGDALEIIGAAVMLGCREGGNAEIDAPAPQPSGPETVEHPQDVADAIVREMMSVELPKPAPTDAQLRALSMASFGRKRAMA